MGFDISAYDEEKNEIAEHRAYMGGFRMMCEQGYDWFDLIDAMDCYGGVSGNGTEKEIQKNKLEEASKILRDFKVTKMSSEERDEISGRREILCEFMQKCIDWCNNNKKESINIGFY